jgi:hypothetical protein
MIFNKSVCKGLPLILLLLVFVIGQAEARLIRSGGTIKGTDSFDLTVQLVDESDINVIGLDGGISYGSFSYNSFSDYVYATPAKDCHYNLERTREGEIRTDCDYEFDLGERLQLQGFVEVFLENSDRYDIAWEIFQGTKSWMFDSSDTYLEDDDNNAYEQGDITRNIFLDAAMPYDMLAGDYKVSLMFRQYAPDGQKYFSYSRLIDPIVCQDIPNESGIVEEVCGQTGIDRDIDSYFSSLSLYGFGFTHRTPISS